MEIGKIDKSKSSCRKCGRIGHWAKECRSGGPGHPEKKSGAGGSKHKKKTNSQKKSGGKKCFTCVKSGHFSKTCYQNKGKPGVKKVEGEEQASEPPSQGGSAGAGPGPEDPFSPAYASQ